MDSSHLIARGLALGLLLQAVGCASPPDWANPMAKSIPLPESQFPPPEDASLQVVLLEAVNTSGAEAVLDRPARAAQQAISKLVTSAGAVVVDRSLPGTLEAELERIEGGGVSALTVEGATDVVRTRITEVENSWQFNKGTPWQDNAGQIRRTPTTCSFTSQISGILQIYGTTPLSLRKTLYFSGLVTTVMESTDSTCAQKVHAWPKAAETAVQHALAEPCLRVPLKNALAPVGYVMERRRIGGTDYFRTSLTPALGARDGTEAEVWQQRMEPDPLTGVSALRRVRVARGEFAEGVGGLTLLQVNEPASAEAIQAGDLVTPRFDEWHLDDSACRPTTGVIGPPVGPMLASLQQTTRIPRGCAAQRSARASSHGE